MSDIDPCIYCNGRGFYWVEVNGPELSDEQMKYYLAFCNPDGSLKLWARWALDPVDLVRRPCPYCTRT